MKSRLLVLFSLGFTVLFMANRSFAEGLDVDTMINEGIDQGSDHGLFDPSQFAPEPHPGLQAECYQETRHECFKIPLEKVNIGFDRMEKLFIIRKKTMRKFKLAVSMADGAADMQQYANYYWKMEKGMPNSKMNQSKKKFLNKYETKQNKLISRVNDYLIQVGQCAKTHCQDETWYARVGSPIYQTLRTKYLNLSE